MNPLGDYTELENILELSEKESIGLIDPNYKPLLNLADFRHDLFEYLEVRFVNRTKKFYKREDRNLEESVYDMRAGSDYEELVNRSSITTLKKLSVKHTQSMTQENYFYSLAGTSTFQSEKETNMIMFHEDTTLPLLIHIQVPSYTDCILNQSINIKSIILSSIFH
jgi:hypothetical protein